MKIRFPYYLLFWSLLSCSSGDQVSNRGLLSPEVKKQVTAVRLEKLKTGPSINQTNTAFKDVTKEYGLDGVEGVTQYAVDFNQDGFVDLVILPDYYAVPQFFQFNRKLNKFIKLQHSPLPRELRVSFMAFADFNRDGVYDILTGAPKQKSSIDQDPLRFFRGTIKKGKVFYSEVKGKYPGELMVNYGVTILDLDLDGNLDFFLGNWFDYDKKRIVLTPDRLYRGKGFSFSDFSSLLQDEHHYLSEPRIFPNARPTYGVTSCDVDQNGYPDIITAASSGYGNKLWMNVDDPESGRLFVDYGKESGVAHDLEGAFDRQGGGNTFFAGCIDYNNDGIMDIILGELSHSYDPETRDRSSILSGKHFKFPPEFLRTEYYMDDGTPSWNQGDKRAVFLDYNLDGNIDIGVDNSGFPPKSRFVLFEQEPNHAFFDVAKTYGLDILNPSGTTILDFNRDGRPDLLVGQNSIRTGGIKKRIFLYKNITHNDNQSVRLFLRGKKTNTYGVGALVKFVTDKKVQTRYLDYLQGGFSSQNEEGPIFGVASGETLKYIEIHWPIAVKGKPLVKRYSMTKIKLKKKNDLTLCESGRVYKKKTGCK